MDTPGLEGPRDPLAVVPRQAWPLRGCPPPRPGTWRGWLGWTTAYDILGRGFLSKWGDLSVPQFLRVVNGDSWGARRIEEMWMSGAQLRAVPSQRPRGLRWDSASWGLRHPGGPTPSCPVSPELRGEGTGQASCPHSELRASDWTLTSLPSVCLCLPVCLSAPPAHPLSPGCPPSSPCSSVWSPARRFTSPTSQPGSFRLGSRLHPPPLLLLSPFPDR